MHAKALVRATSPFADYTGQGEELWLEPAFVAGVAFTGRFDSILREPVFRGPARHLTL